MNAFKDRTEGGAITVFSHGGLELKKTLMASMGSFNPYLTEIKIDSSSPVFLIKKDLLHQLKTRDRYLRIEAVDEITKKTYQGFWKHDYYHRKSHNEDTIKGMGCHISTTVYHQSVRKKFTRQ